MAILFLLLLAGTSGAADPIVLSRNASVPDVLTWFGKIFPRMTILTFVGYSGAEYEDAEGLQIHLDSVLSLYSPRTTVVNVGATPEGIGIVYDIAKAAGFLTTGIVSTQALAYSADPYSPMCDYVWFVADQSWGGYIPGTIPPVLYPTSQAMVAVSDVLVSYGGGDVGRDELTSAREWGKKVQFVAMDMNHQIAIDKAKKKGLPVPTDFSGAASKLFAPLVCTPDGSVRGACGYCGAHVPANQCANL